ncbi:MAG: hypothetical protein AAGA35_04100, partial [Patescibacteria group bacterium]
MHFLTDILVAILSGYLALTNGLADFISGEAPAEPAPHFEESAPLSPIPSTVEGGLPLPDILLKNADYPKAAL